MDKRRSRPVRALLTACPPEEGADEPSRREFLSCAAATTLGLLGCGASGSGQVGDAGLADAGLADAGDGAPADAENLPSSDAGQADGAGADAATAYAVVEVRYVTSSAGGAGTTATVVGGDVAAALADAKAAPWSLQAALAGASAGMLIVVADGTYDGRVRLRGHGTPEAPIVLLAEHRRGATLLGRTSKAGQWGDQQVLNFESELTSHWIVSGFLVRARGTEGSSDERCAIYGNPKTDIPGGILTPVEVQFLDCDIRDEGATPSSLIKWDSSIGVHFAGCYIEADTAGQLVMDPKGPGCTIRRCTIRGSTSHGATHKTHSDGHVLEENDIQIASTNQGAWVLGGYGWSSGEDNQTGGRDHWFNSPGYPCQWAVFARGVVRRNYIRNLNPDRPALALWACRDVLVEDNYFVVTGQDAVDIRSCDYSGFRNWSYLNQSDDDFAAIVPQNQRPYLIAPSPARDYPSNGFEVRGFCRDITLEGNRWNAQSSGISTADNNPAGNATLTVIDNQSGSPPFAAPAGADGDEVGQWAYDRDAIYLALGLA